VSAIQDSWPSGTGDVEQQAVREAGRLGRVGLFACPPAQPAPWLLCLWVQSRGNAGDMSVKLRRA